MTPKEKLRNLLSTVDLSSERVNAKDSSQITEKGRAYLDKVFLARNLQEPTLSQFKAKLAYFFETENLAKGNLTDWVNFRNKDKLHLMSCWATDTEVKEIDCRKGLMLVGPVGTGKTVSLRALQKTLNFFKSPKSFHFNYATRIFDDVQSEKDYNIKPFYFENRAFDEVGFSEPFIQSFGNTIRPIEQIFRNRYNNNVVTHMTTNLSPSNGKTPNIQNFEYHFDERILDRFNEMFNVLPFLGNSFRKK